ncbi:MAG: urease accessory UreF family protein, partial [Chloroflexota bacterium]
AFPRDSVMTSYRDGVADGSAPGCGAVALGVVAGELAIPGDLALAGYLHSLTLGTLNAAQRLLSTTHSQSQQILARAQPLMTHLIESVRGRDWQDMACFTPELDIAAAEHETDHVRMFAS